MPKVAVIGSQAFALLNFRMPLLRAMRSKGHEVYAFAPDFSPADIKNLEAMGVRPISYSLSRNGTNPLEDLRTIISLVRALRETSCGIMLSFTIKPVIYGSIAGRIAGVKKRYALITGLGYTLADSGYRSIRQRLLFCFSWILYRLSLSSVNGVFMQNVDDRDAFVQMRIVPPSKILGVFPTGVNLSEWPFTPSSPHPLTFVLVARMLRDKGILEFVAAARILKAQDSRIRFVLAGGLDSNPNAISKRQLEGFVAEGVVDWIGHVLVKPVLQTASVFVLPSYHEGLPRSTQEAMAMGRPVITTDVPGCRETVVTGRNGFLVPPRDVPALVRAMRLFVDNPGLLDEMGHQSRLLAEERFDVDVINDKLISFMGM